MTKSKRIDSKRDPLPPPLPTKPWDSSLRPFLQASAAARENAKSLLDDAALLFRNRRYARSLALGISGLEEAGKAMLLWLLGLGRVQEERRLGVLEALRFRHKLKQASAVPLVVIASVIPLARRMKIKMPPRGMRKPKNWDEVEQLLKHMLPDIIAAAQVLVVESGLEGDLQVMKQATAATLEGQLEARRQAGLYTDLEEAGVRSPSSITRKEAAGALRDLRASLSALRVMTSVSDFGDAGVNGIVAATELHERVWQGRESAGPS